MEGDVEIHLSVHLFIHPSIHPSSVHPSTHPPTHISKVPNMCQVVGILDLEGTKYSLDSTAV